MSTDTYSPADSPAVTWQALVTSNPSLASWLKSAATAGHHGYFWWRSWCFSSRPLGHDVGEAIGAGAPPEVFHAAMDTARREIRRVFDEAWRAFQERQRSSGRSLVLSRLEQPSHVQRNPERRGGSAAFRTAKRKGS
jgi:hypothetical protein